MTRKDFELIAAAIRASLPTHTDSESGIGRRYQAELIAEELADALERNNSRFDVVRFLDACGTTEE